MSSNEASLISPTEAASAKATLIEPQNTTMGSSRSRSAGPNSVGPLITPRSPQGLLTDKYLTGDVPSDSRAASSTFQSADHISDEYRTRASALNELAQQRGQSLPQLALQWVLRRPEVTTALVGASSTTWNGAQTEEVTHECQDCNDHARRHGVGHDL